MNSKRKRERKAPFLIEKMSKLAWKRQKVFYEAVEGKNDGGNSLTK